MAGSVVQGHALQWHARAVRCDMFRRAGLAALCRAGSTLLPAAPAGPATLRCAAGNGLPAASPPWITDVMGVGCLSQRARRSPEFELGWARRFSDAAGGAGEGPGDGPAAATAAAATQQTQTPTPLDFGDEPKIVLYRGKGILVFRLLVRAKVAQMGGVAATALLLQTLLRSVSLFVGGTLEGRGGGRLFPLPCQRPMHMHTW